MFRVNFNETSYSTINLMLSPKDINVIVNFGVDIALIGSLAFLTLSVLKDYKDNEKHNKGFLIFRGSLCAMIIGVMFVPFLNIGYHANVYKEPLLRSIIPVFRCIQPFRVVNGYGLFRRMTGVGQQRIDYDSQWGWGGLPPSIVERPEIIIEGLFNGDWHEIDFAWKPTSIFELPRQVAPYQPRLDWQMWFAALGTYQQNPWLIHLMKGILEGNTSMIRLLRDSHLKQGIYPTHVRAKLYHYDFTRIETEWSKRIPGAYLISNSAKDQGSEILWRRFIRPPSSYWSRKFVKEYSPPFEKGNNSVLIFLSRNGFIKTDL